MRNNDTNPVQLFIKLFFKLDLSDKKLRQLKQVKPGHTKSRHNTNLQSIYAWN